MKNFKLFRMLWRRYYKQTIIPPMLDLDLEKSECIPNHEWILQMSAKLKIGCVRTWCMIKRLLLTKVESTANHKSASNNQLVLLMMRRKMMMLIQALTHQVSCYIISLNMAIEETIKQKVCNPFSHRGSRPKSIFHWKTEWMIIAFVSGGSGNHVKIQDDCSGNILNSTCFLIVFFRF